ncbi:MAG: CinA family protein [Caldilineaceae bacterium]
MNRPEQEELIELARAVGQRLDAAGLTLATAESCTGGLIGHLLTEIAGSSRYFEGGAVAYSYEAKETCLGVDHDTLVAEGAVSFAVAAQMAHGARSKFSADIAVAVTGIAGPDGGMPGKPVGTVHIHVCDANGYEDGRRFVWDSDRSGNKLLSAQAALSMTLEYVEHRDTRQPERSFNGQRSTRQ